MTPDPATASVLVAEEFGNPWMARLQEVPPPDPVSAWPPAPGWYLLAVLVLLLAAALGWRAWRRWQRAVHRREALTILDAMERRLDAEGATPLETLPALLKRVALGSFPRVEVASLSGGAFIDLLDKSLGSSEFRTGAGRVLPRLAYDPSAGVELSRDEARALVGLARRWIRKHRGGAGV